MHDSRMIIQKLIGADPSTDKLEDLLNQVIAHGEARLIRRLDYGSLTKSGTRTNSTTVARLQTVLNLATKVNPGFTTTHADLFTLAEDLDRLAQLYVEPLANRQPGTTPISILVSMIHVAANIWKRYGDVIISISAQISTADMHVDIRESLRSRLGHLGHYLPASRRLIRSAKRFGMFRSILIRPMYIEPFDLSNAVGYYPPDIKQRLLDAGAKDPGMAVDLKRLTNIMTNTRNYVDTHIPLGRTDRRYKVHAEIQLLCYYEQQSNTLFPPRVLKSSKDACFLCNEFIKTHGKLYIPKTHGRVYELWMVPDFKALGLSKKTKKKLMAVVARFNEAIEERTVSSYLQETRVRVDPRESGIFSLASSSHAASEATIRQSPDWQASDQLSTPLDTPVADETSSPKLRAGLADDAPFKDATQAQDVMSQPASFEADLEYRSQPTTSTARPAVLILQQGVSYTFIFDTTGATARFHTPKIHVELSFDQARDLAGIYPLTQTKHASVTITVEVTWLNARQMQQAGYTEDDLVDLGANWTELAAAENTLFTEAGLLMQKGTNIVSIRASHT
jgi:hypothetical protein